MLNFQFWITIPFFEFHTGDTYNIHINLLEQIKNKFISDYGTDLTSAKLGKGS